MSGAQLNLHQVLDIGFLNGFSSFSSVKNSTFPGVCSVLFTFVRAAASQLGQLKLGIVGVSADFRHLVVIVPSLLTSEERGVGHRIFYSSSLHEHV